MGQEREGLREGSGENKRTERVNVLEQKIYIMLTNGNLEI